MEGAQAAFALQHQPFIERAPTKPSAQSGLGYKRWFWRSDGGCSRGSPSLDSVIVSTTSFQDWDRVNNLFSSYN